METVINDYISREIVQDAALLPLGNATSLLETGALDSLGLLRLVVFVQERFGVTPEKLAYVEALISWAQAHGVTILDVAIGALAAQPGCSSVIAGAMTTEQVKSNAAAAEWIPSADELAEIDRIVLPPALPA